MKCAIIFLLVPLVLLSETMGIIIIPGLPHFPGFPYYPGFPKTSPKTPAQTCDGPNEVWLGQGDAPNCDSTCATLCDKCLVVFIQAPSGCYCKPTYARDGNGVCIPTWQCRNICPKQ